jgi:mRNA interferase MazF
MPLRGELWWVQLDPVAGSEISRTRPCLVISTDVINERRRTVVVIPLSSSPKAAPPLLVPVACNGRSSVAVVDQIRAVARERLRSRIGMVSGAEMEAVEEGVRQILELL